MKQSTRSWYPGTTQRDRVERELGVGFRMGGGRMYTCGRFMLVAKTITIL